MSERTRTWESFKAESASFVEKLKQIVREGNVRRVVVEHEGRTIAEFPLTAGDRRRRAGAGRCGDWGARRAAQGLHDSRGPCVGGVRR